MPRRANGTRYVICVSNRGYKASLLVRRVYRAIPDAQAEGHGLIRVIDESGEDYLYPENFFVSIELPREAGRAFRAAS